MRQNKAGLKFLKNKEKIKILTPGGSQTGHHPSFVHTSQRGSLAKIHDMNKEAPITKVQSQVS